MAAIAWSVSLLAILVACGDDHARMIDAPIIPADRSGPVALHDCTDYVDRTAPGDDRMISFYSGVAYAPKCMTIAVGQSATWSGDFDMHPLAPGVAPDRIDDDPPGAPDSPIAKLDHGGQTSVTYGPFTAAGDYPYYCSVHFLFGMIGVVRVVP